GDRGEHPDRAFEEIAACTVDAKLFRTRHRMTADETGVVDVGNDTRFHSPDVGDRTTSRLEGSFDFRHHLACGYGDEGDRRSWVDSDFVDRADLQRSFGCDRIRVDARDGPSERT